MFNLKKCRTSPFYRWVQPQRAASWWVALSLLPVRCHFWSQTLGRGPLALSDWNLNFSWGVTVEKYKSNISSYSFGRFPIVYAKSNLHYIRVLQKNSTDSVSDCKEQPTLLAVLVKNFVEKSKQKNCFTNMETVKIGSKAIHVPNREMFQQNSLSMFL